MRAIFLADGKVFTTGFSRMSERQLALWDPVSGHGRREEAGSRRAPPWEPSWAGVTMQEACGSQVLSLALRALSHTCWLLHGDLSAPVRQGLCYPAPSGPL